MTTGMSTGESLPPDCPTDCQLDLECHGYATMFPGCAGCGGSFCSYEISGPEIKFGRCCYIVYGTGDACATG